MVFLPGAVRSVLDPWPTAAVMAELARRRAALVSTLTGTVLEVSGPPATAPAITRPTAGGGGPVFDHVVSVGWLGAADDLGAAVEQLTGWLAPEGWLHIIEPSLGTGPTVRAQRLTATVGHRRTGWRLDRDVPAAIRRSGLVITDLERFPMPVSSVVLRPWVAGRARRRAPAASPVDSAATVAEAGR